LQVTLPALGLLFEADLAPCLRVLVVHATKFVDRSGRLLPGAIGGDVVPQLCHSHLGTVAVEKTSDGVVPCPVAVAAGQLDAGDLGSVEIEEVSYAVRHSDLQKP
jgi:hypothetical protein